MTTDRTGSVLDVERLDAAADAALAAARLDVAAVRARAAVAGRHRARRVVLTAAAAVLLVAGLVVSATAALRSTPQPATVPPGAGALPERVYRAPEILRSVTDAPVARVAVVLSDSVRAGWTAPERVGVVLVSADGGQYRGLPETEVGLVSLSADGRVVAWVSAVGDPVDGGGAREVRWVTVSTGRLGAARLGGDPQAGARVEDLSVSPDGRRIAVSVNRPTRPDADDGTTVLDGWVVDTATGEADLVCRRCTLSGAWDGAGRLLVAADSRVPIDRADWLGRLPTVADVQEDETAAPAAPVALVSADGRRRLVLRKQVDADDPGAALFRVVEVDADESTLRSAALGSLAEATLLAWAGDRAWVRVTDRSLGTSRVREVDLRTGRAVEVLRPAGPAGGGEPYVALIAADVAAGGRTAATPAPADPWWAPVVQVLDVVRVPWVLAILALAGGPFLVRLLVRAVRRARLRWSAPETAR